MNTGYIEKILKQLGFDDRFNTEQTAICVISLFGNYPKLLRIHDIIVHAKKKLKKEYAENTRESIRKGSLKRLVNFGLVLYNKDDPARPTNSGLTNYSLTKEFFNILKSKGNSRKKLINSWKKLDNKMKTELKDISHKVSILLPNGKRLLLSPGPHNILQKHIVNDLVLKKIKQPKVVYLGDTRKKMLYVNNDLIAKLGIILDEHDKLPDVIVWSHKSKKFYVIESVTSVGPVEESRKKEINHVINKKSSKNYKITFTTAFLDRKTFRKFSDVIANDTYVWIASEPEGLIHYSKKGIVI